jgi:hypothetical protein
MCSTERGELDKGETDKAERRACENKDGNKNVMKRSVWGY